MSLPVGTVVRLKIACLGNTPSTLGYVFHDYGSGCQAIFENGNYDGFSNEELSIFLEVVGKSNIPYKFTHVALLDRDWKNGYFQNAFNIKSLAIEKQEDRDEFSNLSAAEIKAIFFSIWNTAGTHSIFLQSFGYTLQKANEYEFSLLKPIALELIRKYNL